MTHVQLRPLQPQTLLGGRYRLEREIGRGGMAIVWLAQDLKLSREVAVKVLLGELAFAMGPERFRREIDTVSRLSHPNILPIEDYGEFEGQMYYVMPFISGETMVADFGIARAITDGGGAKLTSTGVTLGTPTYMSPEQAMADPGIDGRSDIYSLGCVLYEMLAGQPPFSGPTAQAIIARHQLDEAPSLSIVRGTIPEEVEDVVMQALAKLPADRYANAGEMADELRNILSTGARPAKVSERRKNTTKRGLARAKQKRKPYVIAASVTLPVLAGAAFAAF